MGDAPRDSETRPAEQTGSRVRRILKWTGIGLGTLVAVIIIAIVVIPRVVNLGPVKHEIERVASNSTGRTVSIKGPLSLSLFPWVGFDAKQVSVANAPGFGDKPLVQVREADIHVQLIPLIFRNVKVSGITLDQLAVNLARNTKGTSNWSGLGGKKTTEGTAGKTSKSSAVDLAGLSVGRIAVNNMSVNYNDAMTDKHYMLSGINLKASHISSGRPFPLEFGVTFNSRQPHVNIALDLKTQVEFDAKLDHVGLSKGKLDTTISGAGLNQPLDATTRWQNIALDLQKNTAKIAGLNLTAAGATLELDASAQNLRAQPAINGQLRVDPFSPRKLLARLGNPIPGNLQGFNLAHLDAGIYYGGNSIRLDHLKLKLDNSMLSGRISVPDLKRKALRFDLALDAINLNQYLPAGSGPAQHAVTQHSAKFMETRLPGRLLSDLDMNGQLMIGKLSGFGLSASNVSMKLMAANGTVKLAPLSAKLYDGSYNGNITLARAGQGIKLATGQTLADIDAGKLITALGGGSRLSGKANAQIQLTGQGATVAELLDTLKGDAKFDIKHGALEGINLWDSLERAYVLVKQHKQLPASGPKRTEFANFKAVASIAHGVVKNDALEATLPFISVTGNGSVNLVKRHLDYSLLAKVVKTPKTANADLSQLKGLTVPIHVSGYFSNMSSAPDIKKALEAKAKAALQKKLDAQKKSAEDKLKKKLQDILGGGGGGGY